MNESEAVSGSAPGVGSRLLRVLALLGLAVGLSFVADLLLLSLLPPSQAFIFRLLNEGLPAVKGSMTPALTLVGLTFAAFCYAGWSLRKRGRRGLVTAGLVVAAVLVADLLVLAGVAPGIMEPLTALMSSSNFSDFGFVAALVGLIPLVVFAAVCRVRSWRWLAAGYAVLGVILGYLATDDTVIRPPATFAQISPPFPGAEDSFNVLMRYGRNHPLGKKFRQPQRIFKDGPFCDATKPAEWPAWLARHRAAIEADRVELAPVRAWIDELNHFDRIGDLMPAQVQAEVISFQAFRAYTHNITEVAGLQAIAGHGDEAVATLLPLLEVSRKLEPSSRSLVRAMISRVMQNIGLSTARFVLDTAPVSPAKRARLAATLTIGIGGEAGVRRLLAIEDSFMVEATAGEPLGNFLPMERERGALLRRSMNLASPFLYNRCRTVNAHGAVTAELQEFAVRRDLAGLKRAQISFAGDKSRPKFKNFMGNYLVGAMVPAYGKVVEAYWKIEDSRTALLARLAKS